MPNENFVDNNNACFYRAMLFMSLEPDRVKPKNAFSRTRGIF